MKLKTEARIRLDEVRAAISRIVNGAQSVRFRDRQVNRAELASLRMLEQQYAQEVAAEEARAAGRGRNRITYMSI